MQSIGLMIIAVFPLEFLPLSLLLEAGLGQVTVFSFVINTIPYTRVSQKACPLSFSGNLLPGALELYSLYAKSVALQQEKQRTR